MNTKSMNARIQTLEGQVNALAQAWVYLASLIEIECGIDMEGMEECLRAKHWPGHPDVDREARATLHWLCDLLDSGRAVRKSWQEAGRQ